MYLRILLTGILAFLFGLVLGKLLIPALRALKAGQSIREVGPKWHNGKAGTPTMGGLIFILAAAVCLLTGWNSGGLGHVYGFVFSLVFGVIGFLDDFVKVKYKRNLGLTALQKLVLQLAAASCYVMLLRWSGHLTGTLYIPFANVAVPVNWAVYVVFAMFVIVGCVNAVNLTDGIDGLATGVTMPVMLFYALAAAKLGRGDVAVFAIAIFGGLAAFLCFNYHPAKIFMGDTGSLFLGGAVCGLAFALDMPLVLVLVGLVYIIETLSDIIQVSYFKLSHGKRVFKMAPIHHHFEMCGWSETKIFRVFTGITVVMCIVAWFGVRGIWT